MHLGIVSTLLHGSISRLHDAEYLLTGDLEAPRKWGRAAVRCISTPGALREHGVALVWGPDAEACSAQLRAVAPPDPVVLVVLASQTATGPGQADLAKRVQAMRARGQRAEVVLVPHDGVIYQLRISGRDIAGLPAPGERSTLAPAPKPEAPRAPVRPEPPQVRRAPPPPLALLEAPAGPERQKAKAPPKAKDATS